MDSAVIAENARRRGREFWAVVKRRLGWKWFVAFFPIDADEVACLPLAARNIYERPVLAERKLARQVQSRNHLKHRNRGVGDSKSVRVEFRKVQGGFRH